METFGLWIVIATVALGLSVFLLLALRRKEVQRRPAREKILAIDGWEFHYRIEGHGPAMLLVHGIGASFHSWHELEPLLSRHYRVISLDLPGFGGSSKNTSAEYGLDHQAERVMKFLDQLGVSRCVLVGHSMGGNLVLWMSRLHPERFYKVIAIAPAAHPKLVPPFSDRLALLAGPASWLFTMPVARFFHRRTRGRPDLVSDERVLQSVDIYRRHPEAIKTFFAALKAISDPRLATATFENPVLVLWGEKDRLVPRWVIDGLMPRLSGASLSVHPWAGHEIFEDDPQWTYDEIMRFLNAPQTS